MLKSISFLLSIVFAVSCTTSSTQDDTHMSATDREAKMINTKEVVNSLMTRYAAAVNANDSSAYAKLFVKDAIRVPPGSSPQYGPTEIAQSEQSDYDLAKWQIKMTPIDAIALSENWVYAMIHVDASLNFYADGKEAKKDATKGFLLEKQPSGEWLIKRYMWNLK